MKRWIILAAVVVALSSTATVAIQYMPVSVPTDRPSFPVGSAARGDTDQWRRPKAVVEGNQVFDFGTMPQQAVGKHAWVVRNEGKGNLQLTMISSTCSCTLAKFKDGKSATVKPGDSTEITLEFETRASNGDYEKGAQIGSNDPDLPEFPLHVKGKVYPAVMLYPPLEGNVLNLLDVSNDVEEHVSHVGIFSKDRPGTKIVKATSSAPDHIRISWEPVKPEDLKAMRLEACEKLMIAVKSDLPLGTFRHEVVVKTDHPVQPELRLTVIGTLLGPVNLAAPGRLMVHYPPINGKLGGKGELDITVSENRATKFEVVQVPKGLTAAVTPGDNPNRKGHYRLVVTVPPGTPARTINDRVELKTDHPKAQRVVVPVSIFVTNPE